MELRANLRRRGVAVAVALAATVGVAGLGAWSGPGAGRHDRPEAANTEPVGGSSSPTSDPVLTASLSG